MGTLPPRGLPSSCQGRPTLLGRAFPTWLLCLLGGEAPRAAFEGRGPRQPPADGAWATVTRGGRRGNPAPPRREAYTTPTGTAAAAAGARASEEGGSAPAPNADADVRRRLADCREGLRAARALPRLAAMVAELEQEERQLLDQLDAARPHESRLQAALSRRQAAAKALRETEQAWEEADAAAQAAREQLEAAAVAKQVAAARLLEADQALEAVRASSTRTPTAEAAVAEAEALLSAQPAAQTTLGLRLLALLRAAVQHLKAEALAEQAGPAGMELSDTFPASLAARSCAPAQGDLAAPRPGEARRSSSGRSRSRESQPRDAAAGGAGASMRGRGWPIHPEGSASLTAAAPQLGQNTGL